MMTKFSILVINFRYNDVDGRYNWSSVICCVIISCHPAPPPPSHLMDHLDTPQQPPLVPTGVTGHYFVCNYCKIIIGPEMIVKLKQENAI